MGAARRIGKNTFYLGTAEIVSRVLQFIVMLYAARLLSQQNFGKFNFAISLSFIAVILADLGINTLLVREISRNKNLASKYFVNAFSSKIVLSIIAFFVVVVALNILDYPSETKEIVYIIWMFTMLSTFTELFYSIFRAFEMMFYDAFLKIFRMMILAAAAIYVLFKGYGVVIFSYMFVLAEIIVVLIAFLIAITKFIKLGMRIEFSFSKSLIKNALPFGMAFIFGTIYFFIGTIILSKIRGDVEVAIYSVAYNIALAILFIPNVYTNAIYPVMSRYFKKSEDMLVFIYTKSFKYLYMIGLPISVGLYMLANRIVIFFYGRGYYGSIIALQIISWFLFIKFINFLNGTTLSSINRQNKRMVSQGATSLFNIAINTALIPKIGYIGAAFSILITEIFLFILYYHYVAKYLHTYNFFKILVKPTIAAGIMALYIFNVKLDLVLLIPTSAIIYFAMLILLKAFEKDDYELFKKVMGNE